MARGRSRPAPSGRETSDRVGRSGSGWKCPGLPRSERRMPGWSKVHAAGHWPESERGFGLLVLDAMLSEPAISTAEAKTDMTLRDSYGRAITDLRISVTDRCNFRCVYCRSANPGNHMAEHALLRWDELERLARILVGLGIRKIRVTGGEPLVRHGVEEFVASLRALGVADLSMTTNGHLLAERCDRLVAAGLNRINISLDSLDRTKFEKITRTQAFARVIAGIDAAQASPLRPVKVNAVLVRGLNDDEVELFAAFARERDLMMRFIEFMPLDADRHWTRELVVTAAEIHRRIHARWPLVEIPNERSETAKKYKFADGRGQIGLIAPVSQPFCGFCSRIRLTADGKLRTCLFSKEDHDLRPLLRGRASDAEIAKEIRDVVLDKERGHRINEPDFVPPSRTMVYIGG
jgi:GTP 3',8-cyclase